MAARLRIEQFEIGSLARGAAANARLSASRKSSPQVTMNSGGRSTLNARPSAVRNFRIGRLEPLEELNAQHPFQSDAAIRIIAYGQFQAHRFQRSRTVRTAHRCGTCECDAGGFVNAECGRRFGIVLDGEREQRQCAASRIARQEHAIRIDRIVVK